MKAVCTCPVEIYDADLRGVYQPGQEAEGEAARLLLVRYPDNFRAVKAAKGDAK